LKPYGALELDDFRAHQRTDLARGEPAQLDIADGHADSTSRSYAESVMPECRARLELFASRFIVFHQQRAN
jgi:hypothetical protein